MEIILTLRFTFTLWKCYLLANALWPRLVFFYAFRPRQAPLEFYGWQTPVASLPIRYRKRERTQALFSIKFKIISGLFL